MLFRQSFVSPVLASCRGKGWPKAAFVLLLLCCTGCGSELASVSGVVTLDGEPLRGGGDVRGTVLYYPKEGTGAPAVGLLDEDGEYSISTGTRDGVLPGAYLVTIAATKLIPPEIEGDAPGGRPVTPRHYADPRRSRLRVEVEAGSNRFDFDLVSGAASR